MNLVDLEDVLQHETQSTLMQKPASIKSRMSPPKVVLCLLASPQILEYSFESDGGALATPRRGGLVVLLQPRLDVRGEPANFTKLVLGYIEANFCK